MNRELSKKELARLSDHLLLDKAVLHRINMAGILNTSKAIACLIRKDYEAQQPPDMPKKEIICFLADKYNVSKSFIELVVYNKKINNTTLCENCGKKISKYKHRKNKGNCDICSQI